MIANFHRFLRDEDGATAIEYGLIAALIAVAAVSAMTLLGNELENVFTRVQQDMGNALS